MKTRSSSDNRCFLSPTLWLMASLGASAYASAASAAEATLPTLEPPHEGAAFPIVPPPDTPIVEEEEPERDAPESAGIDNTLLLLPSYNDVRAVYGGQRITGEGNEWKFKQYHTPLSRPVLRIFEWQTGDEGEAFHLGVVQPGWIDQGGSLEYRKGGRSLTRLGFGGSTFEFHPELTIRSAEREELRGYLTWQSTPNGTRLGVFTRNYDLSHDRRLFYPDYNVTETRTFATIPGGPLTFEFSAASRRIRDRQERVQTSPTTTDALRLRSRSASAGVSYRPGRRASVRAFVTAAHGSTQAHGNFAALNADGTVVALDAVAVPAERVTVRGRLRRARYSRNIVGTGYHRGDQGGSVDVKYLATSRLLLRAGWNSRTGRFANRAQGTDRYRLNASWVGLAFRPLRNWELRGQWTENRITDNPERVPTLPGGESVGSILPLSPDRLRRTEVRLSGPLTRLGGITAGWVREERENRSRLVEYDLDRSDVTFWLPLTRRWNLTGTYTTDRMGGVPDYLRPWLSNHRVGMASLSGTIGNHLTLSLLGTEYRVTGAFPAKSRWLALAARQRLTDRTHAEVRLQRETFTDEVTATNSYRANILVLEGRTRF